MSNHYTIRHPVTKRYAVTYAARVVRWTDRAEDARRFSSLTCAESAARQSGGEVLDRHGNAAAPTCPML